MTWSTNVTLGSISSLGGWTHECSEIHLSTKTGARCGCRTFTLSAQAVIDLKTTSVLEMRRIVASGFKLQHQGAAVASITWV